MKIAVVNVVVVLAQTVRRYYLYNKPCNQPMLKESMKESLNTVTF